VAGELVRAWLRTLVCFNAYGKAAAMRLTVLTGKGPVPLHRKHLRGPDEGTYWAAAHVRPGQRGAPRTTKIWADEVYRPLFDERYATVEDLRPFIWYRQAHE